MKMKSLRAMALLIAASSATFRPGQSLRAGPIEIIGRRVPGAASSVFRLLAEEIVKVIKRGSMSPRRRGGLPPRGRRARKDATRYSARSDMPATMTVAPQKAGEFAQRLQPSPCCTAMPQASSRESPGESNHSRCHGPCAKKPRRIDVELDGGESLALEVELLRRAAKIDITSLPFAGSAQTITNLLGGHVNFAMASDVAALPHIKAGKLAGLAVDVESAGLPDVPTFGKLGYPQVNLLASLAFLAPKGCRRPSRNLDRLIRMSSEPSYAVPQSQRLTSDLRTAPENSTSSSKKRLKNIRASAPRSWAGKHNRPFHLLQA